MGNTLSLCSNSPPFESFVSQIQSEGKHSPTTQCKHVLHVWEFRTEGDDLSVVNSPIDFSQPFAIKDDCCYVVLHTFIRKLITTNIDQQIPQNNNDNQQETKLSYLNIFETTKENITPRGQSEVTYGYHSMNPFKLKGKLQYDICIWNGKSATKLVRAVAFSNIISLDTAIKNAESISYLQSYHSTSDLNATQLFYKTTITSSWKKLTSFNGLYNVLTKDYLILNRTSSAAASHLQLRSTLSHNFASVLAHDKSSRSHAVLVSNTHSSERRKKKKIKSDQSEDMKPLPLNHSESSIKIEERKVHEGDQEVEDSDAKSKHLKNLRSISLPSNKLNNIKSNLKLDLSSKPKLFLDVSNLPEELNNDARPPSQERIKRFDKICSKILDNLYLGSDTIARDLEELKRFGITHILNCAGTVCSDYFPDSFVYKTLYLTDGKSEDITCLFYDVLDYFEHAMEEGGKIFVHCHQGISRSSSMIILYLMWKNKTSFAETHEKVKQLREIANPNAGFMCQLISWWNSLSKPVFSPRLYQILPHCESSPSLFVIKPALSLDSRGCFILHDTDSIYLWKGKNSHPILETQALIYVQRLQKYEKASSNVKIEDQGQESAAFRFIVGANLSDVAPKLEYDKYYSLLEQKQQQQPEKLEKEEKDKQKRKSSSSFSPFTKKKKKNEEKK